MHTSCYKTLHTIRAQIYHEIKKDKDEIVYIVVQGVPVVQGAGLMAGQENRGAPPVTDEMAR